MDPIERLSFLASLPHAGAGREKTQPFNWIPSHRVTHSLTELAYVAWRQQPVPLQKWQGPNSLCVRRTKLSQINTTYEG